MSKTATYADLRKRAQALIAEWRDLQANREQRLSSGDPSQVLDTITREKALPAELRRVLAECLEARLEELRKQREQLEREQADVEEQKKPILAEIQRLYERLQPFDQQIALLRNRLHAVIWDYNWLHGVQRRLQANGDTMRLADYEQILRELPPAEGGE